MSVSKKKNTNYRKLCYITFRILVKFNSTIGNWIVQERSYYSVVKLLNSKFVVNLLNSKFVVKLLNSTFPLQSY